MLNAVELDDVEGKNTIGIECELHALTRTTAHKGGWFGLTGLPFGFTLCHNILP